MKEELLLSSAIEVGPSTPMGCERILSITRVFQAGIYPMAPPS